MAAEPTHAAAPGFLARVWARMAHFSRFTMVGAAGIVVNQGLLWLLVSGAGMQNLLAAAALATVEPCSSGCLCCMC